jgi:hypothetical protein
LDYITSRVEWLAGVTSPRGDDLVNNRPQGLLTLFGLHEVK